MNAFIFVGDTLVNYEIVLQGWSGFYDAFGMGRYAEALKFAEQEAREKKRGLHR